MLNNIFIKGSVPPAKPSLLPIRKTVGSRPVALPLRIAQAEAFGLGPKQELHRMGRVIIPLLAPVAGFFWCAFIGLTPFCVIGFYIHEGHPIFSDP
jgi:hypothetical protein